MSDSDDKRENEQPPEGMVRKRRRVRKKRKSGSSSSREPTDATKLFSKAKELLIGMQDEDEDYGPVDVAEQVRRLQRKKEDDRALDDVWGTKKRSTIWLWFSLIGVITAVIAVVVGLTIWVNEDNTVDVDPSPPSDFFMISPEKLGDGPLGWYNENSVEVLDEVTRIIQVVNNAEEVQEIEKLVRDSPFRAFSEIDLAKWGSKLETNSLSGFQWAPKVVYSPERSGSKERGYLEISGTRENGEKFSAYFVNEDGRVVLDWDATIGWSEMSVPEMIAEAPRKNALVRCEVTKKDPSFDLSFGGQEYSGYLLAGENIDRFFFAYIDLSTERGRTMDRDLRLSLNYGSLVTDTPPFSNRKSTLRVRFNSEIGSNGRYEIVEYLNDGWVTP